MYMIDRTAQITTGKLSVSVGSVAYTDDEGWR
jgi:hypothetical protein